MAYNLYEMSELIWKKATSFQYPCLFVHGQEDRLSPCADVNEFYQSIRSEDKNMHIVEGGFHEMHFDRERGKVTLSFPF